VTELFLEDSEPTESCTMHQRVALDQATGLRATADTPPDRIVERVYALLPPEAQEWAREQGLPEPPPALDLQATGSRQRVAFAPRGNEGPLLISHPDAGSVYLLDPSLPHRAQQIVIAARPGEGTRLVKVTLLVDNQPLARFSAPPYRALWQLELGAHLFSAQGEDLDGKRVTSNQVWIKVQE